MHLVATNFLTDRRVILVAILAILSIVAIIEWVPRPMSPGELLDQGPAAFASAAVADSLSFRVDDADSLNLNQQYFTPQGWKNFLQELSRNREVDSSGVPLLTSSFKGIDSPPSVQENRSSPGTVISEVKGTITIQKPNSKPYSYDASVWISIRLAGSGWRQRIGIEQFIIAEREEEWSEPQK